MATRTDTNLARAAELFHALSDQTRLSILQRLRMGERCVCDLTDALDAAQSRLSFHLKVLKEAGLVTDRREGRWTYYTLDAESLAEVTELVEAMASAQRSAGAAAAEPPLFWPTHQPFLMRMK
jgi:ArsR family transcriptional regulator